MTFYEIEELKKSEMFQAIDKLSDAHNSYGVKPEDFAHCFCLQHRTLQQNMMRSIVALLKMMASDEHGHDLRNEGSYKFAKSIADAGLLDEAYLPFV